MYDVTHSMVAGLGVAGGARYAAGPRSGHQSEGGRRRLLWTAWELLWTVGATVDWTSNTSVRGRRSRKRKRGRKGKRGGAPPSKRKACPYLLKHIFGVLPREDLTQRISIPCHAK